MHCVLAAFLEPNPVHFSVAHLATLVDHLAQAGDQHIDWAATDHAALYRWIVLRQHCAADDFTLALHDIAMPEGDAVDGR